MLRVGQARVRITPPLGSLLAGNAGLRREAEGVHDHLYARALVFESDETIVGLVSCDVVGVDQETTDRIRSQVSETVAISPENLLVAATHTHTGPQTVRIFRDRDEAYVDQFVKQVVSAVRLAHADLGPGDLGVAMGEEPELAHNRRLITNDENVVLPTQDYDSDHIRGAEGQTDPTLGTLRVAADGRLQSILVNYTTHTDVVTGYKVSADFPGYLAAALRDVYGDELVVPYLSGAAGNVSTFDPSRSYESRSHYIDPKGLDRAKRIGRHLAGSTLRIVSRPRTNSTDDPTIDGARQTVSVTTRQPPADRLSDAKDVLSDESASLRENVLARGLLSFAEYQSNHPSVDLEVQVLRLGGAVVVGLPGEPFVEFGLRIREAVPGPVFVAGYANDQVGYLPTTQAFENGGYETTAGWISRFTPSAGDELADAAIDLAQSLVEQP